MNTSSPYFLPNYSIDQLGRQLAGRHQKGKLKNIQFPLIYGVVQFTTQLTVHFEDLSTVNCLQTSRYEAALLKTHYVTVIQQK